MDGDMYSLTAASPRELMLIGFLAEMYFRYRIAALAVMVGVTAAVVAVYAGARWVAKHLFSVDDPTWVWEFFSGSSCLYFALWMTFGKRADSTVVRSLEEIYNTAIWATIPFLIGCGQTLACVGRLTAMRLPMTIMTTSLWFVLSLLLILKQGIIMPTGFCCLAFFSGLLCIVKFHKGVDTDRGQQQPTSSVVHG